MSDPKEILERRLRQALQHRKTQGLHFFCQIGGRYLDSGMTTLQVSGSGWALLGWRNDENRQLYSVELTWEDQKRLYDLLLEHSFWETSPARRDREEDEINVHLRLSDREAGTYSGIHFWDTEMEEFPQLKGLMWHISKLIQNISDADVPAILEEALEDVEPMKLKRRAHPT